MFFTFNDLYKTSVRMNHISRTRLVDNQDSSCYVISLYMNKGGYQQEYSDLDIYYEEWVKAEADYYRLLEELKFSEDSKQKIILVRS